MAHNCGKCGDCFERIVGCESTIDAQAQKIKGLADEAYQYKQQVVIRGDSLDRATIAGKQMRSEITAQAERIAELEGELKTGNALCAKLTDKCRELETEIHKLKSSREVRFVDMDESYKILNEQLEARLIESHKDFRIQNDEICRLQDQLKDAEECIGNIWCHIIVRSPVNVIKKEIIDYRFEREGRE